MDFIENITVYLIAIFVILISIVLYLFKRHAQYWINQRIPTYPNYIPVLGSLGDVCRMKISPGEFFKKCYNSTDDKVLGIFIFHKPALVIRCPDLIKQIFVRDFDDFTNHYVASNKERDPVGTYNLFCVKSPYWKIMRTKLTPLFTPGKMKNIFSIMKEIGKNLEQHISELVNNDEGEVIVTLKDLCAKYTSDVLAICLFGIHANSLNESSSKFYEMARKMLDLTLIRRIEFSCFFFLPKIVKYLKFQFFGTETTEYLREATKTAISSRENSGLKRNDLIDILIKLKNAPPDATGLKFDGDILVSQMGLFMSGGFDTSSSTMAFALYEIALNPEIQNRLRAEIEDMCNQNNGDITYEGVTEMRYMHMVLSESLRKYPPVLFVDREYTEKKGPYQLPEPHENASLSPGTPIYLSVLGIHMDAKYYPDPERFDPERFTEDAIRARHPNCYLPFGIGPRYCMGETFALQQMKLGLTYILKDFEVQLCPDTPVPVKIDPFCILMAPLGGLPMRIKKIK